MQKIFCVIALSCLWLAPLLAKEAAPALVEASRDEDARIRRYVAFALGELGPNAKGALLTVIAILKDQAAKSRRVPTAQTASAPHSKGDTG